MSGQKGGFRRPKSVPLNNMNQQSQPSPEELAESTRLNSLMTGPCTVEDTNGRSIAVGKVSPGLARIGNVQCTIVENDKQLILIPPARIGKFRYDKPASEEVPA